MYELFFALFDLRSMEERDMRIKENFSCNDDIETIIDGIYKERMKSNAQKMQLEKETAVEQLSQKVNELTKLRNVNKALTLKIASMDDTSSQDKNSLRLSKKVMA